jgi:hypothetical protein
MDGRPHAIAFAYGSASHASSLGLPYKLGVRKKSIECDRLAAIPMPSTFA